MKKAPYPWLETQWDLLIRSYQQGRVPHALLFHGPRGLGKLALAKAFAQRLLCEQEDPCSCTSCQYFNAGTHPDFILMQPEEELIGINNIRHLCESITQTPHCGKYKCVIINSAETMNNAAANALLKTLEEPTPSTVLILVTPHPQQLPATIRSRCISMTFHPPKTTDHSLLLRLAENAPLQALQWQEGSWMQERTQFMADFLSLISREHDPLSLAEKWQKANQESLLFWILSTLYDMVRLKTNASVDYVINNDVVDKLIALTNKVDIKTIFRSIETVHKMLTSHRRKLNRNTTLSLEALMIDAYYMQGTV